MKQTLLSNVNTAVSVTAAKPTRRIDGINWLAKIPVCNIHMVMMNEPRALKWPPWRRNWHNPVGKWCTLPVVAVCCLPQSHIPPTLSEVGSDLFSKSSPVAFWVSLQKQIFHLEEITFTLKKIWNLMADFDFWGCSITKFFNRMN